MPLCYLFKSVVVILLICFQFSVRAIVNTESLRPEIDTGWKAEISLKGEGSRGNTDKSSYSAEIGAGHFEKKETFAVASYTYGESRGRKDSHSSFFHLRHNERITSEFFKWELFYQWQSDEFKRLEQRQLLGTGLRWGLFKNDKSSFWMGAGAFVYREVISENATSTSREEESGRGNFYAAYKWKTATTASLLSVLYYQPRFDARVDNFEDYQLLWDLGIYTPLTKWSQIVLEYSVSYDSRPPSSVQSTDQTYLAGFRVIF